jgi:hypothetical protein
MLVAKYPVLTLSVGDNARLTISSCLVELPRVALEGTHGEVEDEPDIKHSVRLEYTQRYPTMLQVAFERISVNCATSCAPTTIVAVVRKAEGWMTNFPAYWNIEIPGTCR